MLFRYSIRNLLRQRVRSILTLVAIVLAVALVILGHSFVVGSMETMLSGMLEQTGHVRIRDAGYAKKERLDPLGYTVKGWREKRDQLLAIEGIEAVAGRTQFPMMVQYTDESTIVPEVEGVDEETLTDAEIFGRKSTETAIGRAITPTVERKIQALYDWLDEGHYFTSDDASEVMIGRDLASRLGARPGDLLQLISYREGISDATVTLVGIFDSGNVVMNKMAYVTHPVAEALLRMDDEVTELVVFGESSKDATLILERIVNADLASGMEIQPWQEIGLFRTVIPMNRLFTGLLALILIVVAAAGLLNTMMMSVLERQKEIGVIMALGLGRWKVVQIIAIEAGLFAFVGSLVGGIVGSLASLYFGSHGITLTPEQTKDMPFAINGDIEAMLTPEALVYGIAVGLIVSIVAAFAPALKASSLSPVDAMRR